MASTPTSPAAPQPPPDLPSMPDVSSTLSDYLRRFALWARNGFADKLSITSAQPDLMLMSVGGFVYRIKVGDDGRLTSTPLAMGSGAEGAPVLAFAPIGATVAVSAGSPTGTNSATYRMMGLGATLSLTPSVSSKVEIYADGQLTNNTTTGEADLAICYGTGVAPVNGAAQVGTLIMPVARSITGIASTVTPFSMVRRASNLILSPATPYWFDLALASPNGGLSAAQNVHMSVHEVAS